MTLPVDLASKPIRNRCFNPVLAVNANLWQATAGGDGVAALSRVLDTLHNFARVTWSTANTTNPPAGGILYNGSAGPDHVEPGVPVQISARVRCSIAQTVRFAIGWRNSAGAVVNPQTVGAGLALAANQWTDLSGTFTPPATATRVVITIGGGVGSVAWTAGATLDATRLFIGPAAPVYVDGSIPGWLWTGTVGASESVGYPYTLESIAGPPLIHTTTKGLHTLAESDATPLSGLSLYAVYDVLSLATGATSAQPIAAVGGTNVTTTATSIVGAAEVRNNVGGSGAQGYFRIQPETGAASAANTPIHTTADRKVSALTVSPTGILRTFGQDGGYIAPFAQGAEWTTSGIPLLRANLAAASAQVNPVAMVAYRGPHDDLTVKRIMAWLARRYASPAAISLESVAGQTPLASIFRAGSAQSAAISVPADSLLSLYGVGARRGQPNLGIVRATPTDVAVTSIGLQESSSTIGQAVGGFGDGAGPDYARTSGAVSDVPVVMCARRVSQTSGSLATIRADAAIVTNSVTLANWPAAPLATLRHVTTTAADQWDAIHLFSGAHDVETRNRVMAWLARKYGAPIPAGY